MSVRAGKVVSVTEQENLVTSTNVELFCLHICLSRISTVPTNEPVSH